MSRVSRSTTAGSLSWTAPLGRLSAEDADPAQVAFSLDSRTLVVTERGTDSISTYTIDEHGYATGPTTISSSGKTPYGFGFTADGAMIVTEAFGGAVGAAAASSYSITDPGKLAPVSGSVGDTRSEVCWAAVTNDGSLRLCDQLRRRNDLELRDRQRRRTSAARRGCGLDATR